MRSMILVAAVLLVGCTVANGPRMKFAGESFSPKPVDQVAGCIATQMASGRATTLRTTDTATGKRLTVTTAVQGINFVQQIVDVEKAGEQTRVAVLMLQADVPAGSPVQEPLARCL
jgi:maltodextrin utilization protein YvdJ